MMMYKSKACQDDDDCLYQQFCYNTSCLNCTNCSEYLRKKIVNCSKSPQDCGDCIEGYKDLTLNYKSRDKYCSQYESTTKIYDSTITNNTDSNTKELSNAVLYSIILIVAVFLILIFILIRYLKKCVHNLKHDLNPPTYEETMHPGGCSSITLLPSAPIAEGTPNIINGQPRVNLIEEKRCEAIPINPPSYIRLPTSGYEPEEMSTAHLEENNLDVDDENTAHSSWEPVPMAENSPTTFDNILRSNSDQQSSSEEDNRRESNINYSSDPYNSNNVNININIINQVGNAGGAVIFSNDNVS